MKTKATPSASATTAGANHPERFIVPAALSAAATVYADRPKKLGEIMIAIVDPSRLSVLDEGQRVVHELCRRELAAISDRRESERERHRSNMAAYRERNRTTSNME